MKKFFLHIVYLLLFTSYLFSQTTYTISGKVFDASTKEPLPFVPLIINGTTIGTQSDFE